METKLGVMVQRNSFGPWNYFKHRYLGQRIWKTKHIKMQYTGL